MILGFFESVDMPQRRLELSFSQYGAPICIKCRCLRVDFEIVATMRYQVLRNMLISVCLIDRGYSGRREQSMD